MLGASVIAIAALGFTAQGREGSAPVFPASSTTSGASAEGNEAGPGADQCRALRKAVRYYRAAVREWRERMGAGVLKRSGTPQSGARQSCPRYLARVLRSKAQAARAEYRRWYAYHWRWDLWLPDKWQRIGACETGYGKRPGRWDWNSGTYQGAFGFYHGSWDAFRLPGYPSEAYLATPRQQYEVALAIWRRYGFSGWGCRDA